MKRGAAIHRADLLKPMFIITYNSHNPNLHKWLRDNHNIFLADRKMAKIFPSPPSVSYRQPRSLKQMMVRSRLKSFPYRDCGDLEEKPAVCYRHQHGARCRRCELWPRIKEWDTFRSNFTGKSYKIRHNLTCKSKYCVSSLAESAPNNTLGKV